MPAGHTFVALVRPQPELTCFLRGELYPRDNAHEMPALWTVQKVRKFRKLFIALFYISLLTFPSSALPLEQPHTTIKESRNKITVQVKGCKPLSTEELRAMLGPAFDESKMAYDDASMKRSMELQQMQDVDDDADDDDDGEDFVEDLEAELEETEIDRLGGGKKSSSKRTSRRNRYNYNMRRRRDATLSEGNFEKSPDDLADSQFLYQNLLHDSLRVHSRRKRSYRSSAKPTPPWKCKMNKWYRPLAKGYFPKRIFDGQCRDDKCFYGMYRCNPVKFSVKVLMKDPADACRPVPLIGQNTTYEESWLIQREHVTVACECEYASRSRSGKKRNKARLKP